MLINFLIVKVARSLVAYSAFQDIMFPQADFAMPAQLPFLIAFTVLPMLNASSAISPSGSTLLIIVVTPATISPKAAPHAKE